MLNSFNGLKMYVGRLRPERANTWPTSPVLDDDDDDDDVCRVYFVKSRVEISTYIIYSSGYSYYSGSMEHYHLLNHTFTSVI
jgi:hypothetical protein